MESLLAELPRYSGRGSKQERVRRVQVPLELKIQKLEHMLRLELIDKYGAKSEKLSDEQLALLQLEPFVQPAEVAAEAELTAAEEEEIKAVLAPAQESPAQKPKKEQRGRAPLPAHLPREVKLVACAPKQCTCAGCGAEKTVIGYEESEEIGYKPAVAFVRVIKREKRACRHCEEHGVSTGPSPAKIPGPIRFTPQI